MARRNTTQNSKPPETITKAAINSILKDVAETPNIFIRIGRQQLEIPGGIKLLRQDDLCAFSIEKPFGIYNVHESNFVEVRNLAEAKKALAPKKGSSPTLTVEQLMGLESVIPQLGEKDEKGRPKYKLVWKDGKPNISKIIYRGG